MYTAVLMLAMTSGGETAEFGRRGCNACSGCYSSCHARSSGCQTRHYSSCSCSGGYYRTSYYYAPGAYYASGPAYSNGMWQAPSTGVRQSFYLDPNQPSVATMRVLLANPDA